MKNNLNCIKAQFSSTLEAIKMKKILVILLIIIAKSGLSQSTEIDSLTYVIKQKDYVIDSLKRDLQLLQKSKPENQKINYCFVRFDKRFFKQSGSKQEMVSSFEFRINGKTFPVAYDTIFIPINATGLDTLFFKSNRTEHKTLIKLKSKELYTIYFNECIGTYLIQAHHKYGNYKETGVVGLFNGNYSNGQNEISLSSHVMDTTYVLKNSNTYSARLSPTYDMCGNIPQRIEIRNNETNEKYVSFYFTFIHNEKLRISYYQRNDQLSIKIE